MLRPAFLLPVICAGLLGTSLRTNAQVQTYSAPLTTGQGAAIGTVTCSTNPSIDTQGTCTASTSTPGWCITAATVNPGLPVGRSAQPGIGTAGPGACAASTTVDFTLPVICSGQAYRFAVQVTTRSPAGGGGGGYPPKGNDHDKDRDGKDRDGKDRDGKDRDGQSSSSPSQRSASGSPDNDNDRKAGGRRDGDRDSNRDGKDHREKEKDREKDREKDKDKEHGGSAQSGGGPTVVFSVTVLYNCPVPL
jgi:hypothetical protein